MSAVVLDASVVVKLVAHEPGSVEAASILRSSKQVIAPDVMPLEVASTLWQRQRRGCATTAEVKDSLTLLDSLDFVEVAYRPLLSAALALSLELGHPVYDCVYLLVALTERATLATADVRLADLASRLGVGVAWIDSPT